MEQIHIEMFNKHYFIVDLSKFPESVGGSNENNEVYLPVDKPSGYIASTLGQMDMNSEL